jgi:hypothetical protein
VVINNTCHGIDWIRNLLGYCAYDVLIKREISKMPPVIVILIITKRDKKWNL